MGQEIQLQYTGWDLGGVSSPIKSYIDTIEEKNISILIPGFGNSYEAEYLLKNHFTNVTVTDITPTLVKNLQEKLKNNPNITIVLGDPNYQSFCMCHSYGYNIVQI